MTAIQSQTARLLLDHVPEHDRARVVRDIARSIDAGSREADISLAVALLQLQPDSEAHSAISSHIIALIRDGEQSIVAGLCSENSKLQDELTQKTCEYLSRLASTAQQDSGSWLDVPVSHSSSTFQASVPGDQSGEEPPATAEQALQYLAFIKRVVNAELSNTAAATLFDSCLILAGAVDGKLSTSASEVLFSLLHFLPDLSAVRQDDLWKRIMDLVTAKKPLHKTLGYSLWLRWLISRKASSAILKEDDYWRALLDGLRLGDAERRKSCLQILRASVDICAAQPSLATALTVGAHSFETIDSIRKQYVRFCTVFETIVLGRYLNQMHECEPDLDFLASASSAVRPAFLFVLLESALDQRMQEANRKWIGSWCLRTDIRTDDVDGFMSFLRNILLPWATSGYLFTSTLRNVDGSLYCEHGEKLATYVSSALLKHRDHADRLIGTIAASIRARHTNSFAYSTVYLVEGIGRAFDLDSTLTAEPSHIEDIHAAASWIGLPEIARDHLLARVWKICSILNQNQPTTSSNAIITKAASDWDRLIAKAASIGPGCSVQSEGSISSLSLSPSKRDKNEQNAHLKCKDLLEVLDGLEPTDLEDRLEDIWSDLEYLEYPKGLLSALPNVFLNSQLISKVTQQSSSLTELVTKRAQDLLQLATSRSYMLPNFLESLRASVIADSRSASLMHLNDLIVQIADRPPTATVDAQLEATTIPVLQGVDPKLNGFSYSFYFGHREGYGLAVLLDLVSRLRSIDSKLPLELLQKLLDKYRKQKIPPPTVSSWKKVLQLQVMLLCAEQHIPYASQEDAGKMLKDLHYILSIEPLPRYRYLLEWQIARIYMHHPDLRSTIFDELRTKDHHSNPKFLASLMKIGVNIAKTASSDEDFALQLATVFVPLAASSKVVIRHEAQWQVPILLDHARSQAWKSITQSTAFEALDDFIRSLERYDDPPPERVIDKFDPINDHTLTHLVEGPWHDLDNVEQRQTSHNDFLTLHQPSNPNLTLPPSCIPLGNPPPPRIPTPSSTPIDHSKRLLQNLDNISRALGSGPASNLLTLQTKGAAYLTSTPTRTRHRHLLVIASLVDNPYNLGGLSRVSEIFGAGALYLNTPNPSQITSNKDFQGVSVASHLHIPLKSLLVKNLEPWLRGKKREEGFTIVGIEQTDRSVVLGEGGEGLLPEKCVLVVGSEREGIPAGVLSECDLLVEIPQVGVTRSLNVQTAAGIVLCEYVKQFRRREEGV